MSEIALLLGIPCLSLGIVLLALSTMAPKHKLKWFWRSACVVAALPPLALPVILSISSLTQLKRFEMFDPLTFSLVVSAPFAATMSVALAVRLRRVA
jgi:magnesium-transporting ATPase (P-type)